MGERLSWLWDKVGVLYDLMSGLDRPIEYIIEGGMIIRGVVGVVVLIPLIFAAWVVSGDLTTLQSSRVSLFSGLTNILLTLGLLWVYLSIARSEHLQAKLENDQISLQNDIQSLQQTQVGIMGAEFEPVVEVLKFTTGDNPPSNTPFLMPDDHPFPGDVVNLTLSNPSTAIATNLRLRFVTDIQGPGRIVFGRDVPLSRVGRDETWTAKPGGTLRGEKLEVEYETVAGLSHPASLPDATFPFSYCISQLVNNSDVSRFRVGIMLVYEDRKNEEHEIQLEGLDLSPSDLPDDDQPTLEVVRREANRVPIDLISEEYLREGIPVIPPAYERQMYR
ncbi:hypothetical protein [Natrinema salinisoli]|uniref:hypothetical protein n=1 Tax=Natrinema salinisoli TaxID=2878535 RepID=UPI001CF0373C|nr:hypothetical protein [Natrinema salinisoli]